MPAGAPGGQFLAGMFGAAEGVIGARAQKRKLQRLRQLTSDPAILSFLMRFFPAAVAGGPFARQFLAQAASRNATTTGNLSQQLANLLGGGGRAQGASTSPLNAGIQLAGNQNLNQAGIDLAQLQGNLAAQAIPLQLTRGLRNAGFGIGLGNTSQGLGAIQGFNQGMSAGGGGGGAQAASTGFGGGQGQSFFSSPQQFPSNIGFEPFR